MTWVRERGTLREDGLVFEIPEMPGYRAEGSEYELEGLRVLLVRDFKGEYAYIWQTAPAREAVPAMEAESDEPTL